MKSDQYMQVALMHDKFHSWFFRVFAGLGRDVGYASRMLIKTRGFTITALLTLALCIGANTAIYSMLDALIFKPLPFPEADRIVSVYNIYNQFDDNESGYPRSNITQYLDFEENTDAFEYLALWDVTEFNLVLGDDAFRYPGATATSQLFDVLGLNPF